MAQSGYEIYIPPGGFYFADSQYRLKTLLGSCVAITLWHPKLRVGGMCHYVLPKRLSRQKASIEQALLPGYYGEDAMALFMEKVQQHDANRANWQAKLFGGASMLNPENGFDGRFDVGKRNIAKGQEMLKQQRLILSNSHVGGSAARDLAFDIASGDVWLRCNR